MKLLSYLNDGSGGCAFGIQFCKRIWFWLVYELRPSCGKDPVESLETNVNMITLFTPNNVQQNINTSGGDNFFISVDDSRIVDLLEPFMVSAEVFH